MLMKRSFLWTFWLDRIEEEEEVEEESRVVLI
jgi:hypothetical protein